jgi:hypothetical protein
MGDSGKTDRVTGANILKPQCILEYNQNMGAIDKTDMLQSSIESVRKCVKWYKKIFFFLHYGKFEFYRLHRDEKVGVSTASLAKKKTQIARQ